MVYGNISIEKGLIFVFAMALTMSACSVDDSAAITEDIGVVAASPDSDRGCGNYEDVLVELHDNLGGTTDTFNSSDVDASLFDSCAQLSVIRIGGKGLKGENVAASVIFHKAEVLGRTTERSSRVKWTRKDDSVLTADIVYPTDKSDAQQSDPSGTGTTTLRWDIDRNKLSYWGDKVPSGYGVSVGTEIAGPEDAPPLAEGEVLLNTVAIYSSDKKIYCELEDNGGCGVPSLKAGNGWTWHQFENGQISPTAVVRSTPPKYSVSEATVLESNGLSLYRKANWVVSEVDGNISAINQDIQRMLILTPTSTELVKN